MHLRAPFSAYALTCISVRAQSTCSVLFNWVTLDTRNLGGEIELDNATQQLVPRRGSVVLARFEGSKGRRVQFELFDAIGQPIPFGAVLMDSEGKQLALSDPTGKALALITKDHGVITIKWQGKSCPVPYKLPEKTEGLTMSSTS